MRDQSILYTFAPSHYCEKARWALDLSAVRHREVSWAPGPHVLLSRRLAPATTVPIFVTGMNRVQGSGAILDWIESEGHAAWHRPDDGATQASIDGLETHADTTTGVAVRRFAYAVALAHAPDAVARELFESVAWWQRQLAQLMWPVTRQILRRSLHAEAHDIPAARGDVERELTALDELLKDGRRYLVADRLSRADLAVASLISPIAQPAEHPVYRGEATDAAFADAIAGWQSRPSIQWAVALYRDHRVSQGARLH